MREKKDYDHSELSINPVTNMIYVSDKQMNSISIINGTTNSLVKFVKLAGSPYDVAVNPATSIR
jgi:YVTN family beta-propeller protein